VVFDEFEIGVARLSFGGGGSWGKGSRVRVKGVLKLGGRTIGCWVNLRIWVVKKGWEVSSRVTIN